MELPDKILLQAKSKGQADLSGLIFAIQVQAGTKNSYSILFPKTDVNGLAALNAEDFRHQFNDHHELAMMDYDGSVESACQTVEINLLNVQRMAESGVLAWPWTQYERKSWKSKKEKADYFLSSANEEFFFFPLTVRIESGRTIEVTSGKKRESAKS
jgi:hypothetical protein